MAIVAYLEVLARQLQSGLLGIAATPACQVDALCSGRVWTR
jgi:hypothetical protein